MKTYFIVIGASLLVGILLGYYIAPTKVVTKEKIVTQEVESKKANVQTITRIIEKPTGEKITQIVMRDRTITDTQTQETHLKEAQTSVPQWQIGVMGGLLYSGDTFYGGELKHRFIGPLSLGLVASNHFVGGIASLEF